METVKEVYEMDGCGAMRTKFRAWDSREKVMLSPEDVENGNYALGSHGLMVAHEKDTEHLWNVDHFLTPLFWTGLTDRNGKEIYEGDILRYTFDGKTKVDAIEFQPPMFTYRNSTRWSIEQDEIIGNIYENSELINS